jgi:hypothetical protein
MPSDQTLHDDDESDIIVWPSDQRGRTVNYRMTPRRAGQLADFLEQARIQVGGGDWVEEIDALRQAERQAARQARS